jgi:hypothetical protein
VIAHAHTACGVCSTAQDFGARIRSYDTLDDETADAAIEYLVARNWLFLVTRFEILGFTTQCATLWAHFAATSAFNCDQECSSVDVAATGGLGSASASANGQQEQKLNGPAPQCLPNQCLTCIQKFKFLFDALAGLGDLAKAGITERIARPCDDFFRETTHDPCKGVQLPIPAPPTIPALTQPSIPIPTQPPTTSISVPAASDSSTGGDSAGVFKITSGDDCRQFCCNGQTLFSNTAGGGGILCVCTDTTGLGGVYAELDGVVQACTSPGGIDDCPGACVVTGGTLPQLPTANILGYITSQDDCTLFCCGGFSLYTFDDGVVTCICLDEEFWGGVYSRSPAGNTVCTPPAGVGECPGTCQFP